MTRVFAWLGGALFVTALAVCAYEFLVAWGRAASPALDWRAAAADAALFTIFAAHHSLFARGRVKAVVARVVPAGMLRSVYVSIASLLLIAVCVGWRPVGGELYAAAGWRALLHAGVQVTGVWLIARSVGAIDALELAGIRQRPATESLQLAGPYRLVRHPLYLGWLLAVFGPAHLTGDRLTFGIVTTIYLIVAIRWEERALVDAFGDAYVAYQREVRWRLLPYVY